MNHESPPPSDSDDVPALLGGRAIRPSGPPPWPLADPAVEEALRTAYAGGDWSRYHGPFVQALAQRLCERHGCEHAIPVCSGTIAIELALRGLQVGSGDEVVLAAYDFKGNIGDVHALGAMPVLVDVDPESGNLDANQLEAAIGPQTKAIVASHLHGGTVPMPLVMDVARRRGVPVVEDACQMPGAVIHGRVAGTWGDVGVHSFGGSKLLGCGRGGALFTRHAEVAQRVRLFSHRGNDVFPLSELQAAVLLPQLDRLDERNALRTRHVAALLAKLGDCPGLKPFGPSQAERELAHHGPPQSAPETRPGHYKLGFWYDPAKFGGLSRDLFVRALRAEGIAFDAGFRALHLSHGRRRYRAVGELPHATRADERIVVLHHPVLLGADDDLDEVVRAVAKIRRHAATIVERAPSGGC